MTAPNNSQLQQQDPIDTTSIHPHNLEALDEPLPPPSSLLHLIPPRLPCDPLESRSTALQLCKGESNIDNTPLTPVLTYTLGHLDRFLNRRPRMTGLSVRGHSLPDTHHRLQCALRRLAGAQAYDMDYIPSDDEPSDFVPWYKRYSDNDVTSSDHESSGPDDDSSESEDGAKH